MGTWLQHLDHWHWWILTIVLLVFEAIVPGFFFMWLGISAGAVGLLVFLFPGIGWDYQVFVFAILAVASIVAWRSYAKRKPLVTDQPTLNRRGAQYVGRTFTLAEPIEHGRGKIRVDDTTWKIEGEDSPAGSQVRVIGVDGVMLRVERVTD